MQSKPQDLHGAVPNKLPVVLLIDVINDLEFEVAEKLARYVLPMAKRIAKLKRLAKEAGSGVVMSTITMAGGRATSSS